MINLKRLSIPALGCRGSLALCRSSRRLNLIPIRTHGRDHLFQSLLLHVPGSFSIYPENFFQVLEQERLLLTKPEAATVVLRFGEVVLSTPIMQGRNADTRAFRSLCKGNRGVRWDRQSWLATPALSAGLQRPLPVFWVFRVELLALLRQALFVLLIPIAKPRFLLQNQCHASGSFKILLLLQMLARNRTKLNGLTSFL